MNRNATLRATGLIGALLFAIPAAARAQAAVGQPARGLPARPTRRVPTRSLDAYKGKWVVMEWVNFECPFVKKHYGSGNMQQDAGRGRGQGRRVALGQFLGPGRSRAPWTASWRPRSPPEARDADRGPARSQRRRRTRLRRQDHAAHVRDRPARHRGVCRRHRRQAQHGPGGRGHREELHVLQALDEAMAGKPVSVASTQPYGCSVKY